MAETAVKPSSRIVVPHAPKWYQRLAGWLIFVLIRTLSLTLRYTWTDRSGFFDVNNPPGAGVYCIWHNRLALSMIIYFSYMRKRIKSTGLAVMVSASKDGGFLAAILECFGVQPIRGSSSRRGAQALRELTTWARRGYDLAITPDGPRGPCYVVQDGIIALAQLTERPIVPISYRLGWKIQLKSWDRFQIPLPFSKCEVFFEKPISVPRSASEAERENYRLQLERALNLTAKD
ncbi:MAG: hypothetical protein JWR26_5032 [Pedosphaera sp.]|nr:hypothetical protein [Pedosphaera sp.]